MSLSVTGRETIGTIAYALPVLLVTHAVLADRLIRARHDGRLQLFLRTAAGFAAGAVMATALAYLINWTALTDFCNYLVIGLATFLGPLIAYRLQTRLAQARKYTLTVLLCLATLEVLLIPRFLLG